MREVNQQGFALITVLVFLLAFTMISAGMVFNSIEEARIVRNSEAQLRARLAVESAVRAELGSWDTRMSGELDPGEVVRGVTQIEGVETRVERLASQHTLIEARTTGEEGAVATAAVIVRGIDPLELWAQLPAAVSTTGPVVVRDRGRVDGYDPSREGDCDGHAIEILVHLFGSPLIPPVYHQIQFADREPYLGPFTGKDLSALADRVETGSVMLEPISEDHEPGSTAELVPLIYAPGDLEIAGGSGHAIVVAAGDLTLSGATTLSGIAIVMGKLILGDEAQIHGAANLIGEASGAEIRGDARVTYDPCSIRTVLEETQITRQPFHPEARGWIPWF